MRYGIRNGSLKAGWEDALRIAGEIGFDGVELVVRPEDDVGELLTEAGRERVRSWCREAGCVVSSLSVAAFRQVSFGSADAEARERGVPFVEQCLRACRAVGGDAVLLPHFEREAINPTEEQERNFITVDWPGCRDAIRAMSYDGWLVFGTPGGDDPRDAATRNLRFARELFGA
jgi:L-ribulose-5-phosphate 3-epimerase UlaE